MLKKTLFLLLVTALAFGCKNKATKPTHSTETHQTESAQPGSPEQRTTPEQTTKKSSVAQQEKPAIEVKLNKELTYTDHTLADTYPYKDTVRRFQWQKIHDKLVELEMSQAEPTRWVTLQNYKNKNGVAPEVQDPEINEYRNATDKYGVSRYQSIPLYGAEDLKKPERYGRDGSLFKYLKDTAGFIKVCSVVYDGTWYVPKEYARLLSVKRFDKVIFVDRTNQNIATMEKGDGATWYIRSMNPATTGLRLPPYQQETPLGTYVIQEKKPKMYFLRDGSYIIAGLSPWASRFTRGGYIHGIPVNKPNATPRDYVELSPTLGTTPKSHMCVRNATSHAKYVYDWAAPLESLVIVMD